MFPGQWIHVRSGSLTLWSPWFPRGADNAIFTYEQMVVDQGTLDVKVFTKNSEDKGDGADMSASFSQVSSTTFFTSSVVSDIEELVRFRYTLTVETSPAMVLFRVLSPTWITQAT